VSISSPVLQAAPAKAIIIPIDLDDASAFHSETTPDVPAVLIDHADRPAPFPVSPSPALSISWTSRERPLLLGLGIVVFAIAGVATSVVATAALDNPAAPPPPTGAVTITSEPSGSPVTIDGEMRGSTPLATILTAGSHVVAVGTTQVPRRLEVPRGGDVRLHVQSQLPTEPQVSMAASTVNAPVATVTKQATTRTDKPGLIEAPARAAATGWLAVSSPFPVQILDDGREVGTSANAVALPAGDRTVVLVNAALEFREERHVKVLAQKKTLLTVDRPNGILHVNARPWADVWIDGRRVGETPLGNIAIPIGDHEVVFRHPGQPEKLTTVTVGARSATRVTMEFQP
jgi:hypothetical protein